MGYIVPQKDESAHVRKSGDAKFLNLTRGRIQASSSLGRFYLYRSPTLPLSIQERYPGFISEPARKLCVRLQMRAKQNSTAVFFLFFFFSCVFKIIISISISLVKRARSSYLSAVRNILLDAHATSKIFSVIYHQTKWWRSATGKNALVETSNGQCTVKTFTSLRE